MLKWLLRWYNRRRRVIDVQLLWPACVSAAAGDLEKARDAFSVHAFNDDAWADLHEYEIARTIQELGRPT